MKNVILLTIDCLRKDVVNKHLTPFLWEISKRGVVFENCFSVGSWTMPSFKAILTSTYPLMPNGKLTLEPHQKSIAKVLKKKGFKTAGFVFHPCLHRLMGYNAGFDDYFDEFEESGREANRLLKKSADLMFRFIKNEKILKKTGYYYSLYALRRNFRTGYKFCLPAKEINRRVINMLKRSKKTPFFCWIHYLDAHFPYLPEKSKFSKKEVWRLNILREKWYRGGKKVERKDLAKLKQLYHEKVREMDNALRELFEGLAEEKLIEDTIIVITSDHGEEFFGHGEFAHGFNLYDELIHVPLIIFDPALKGRKVIRIVSQIDLAPTILDLVSIKSPSIWVGKSLFDQENRKGYVISEEGQRVREEAMRNNFNFNLRYKKIAIRTKKMKYIYNQAAQDELYDLSSDRQEKRNIISHGVPKKFKKILEKHLKRLEVESE